jgi:tRNA A-37 threonylcarbamoyl transferase component Bud32
MLSGTDAAEVERHLEACAECAERLEQLPEERLDGLVREAAVAPDPWAGSASGAEIPMPLLPASRRMSGPWAAVTTSGAFRTEPLHAPPPGYEIICEAGRGGMAVVYKARHVRSRRLVALKMLGGAARDDARELVERFRTEAAALSALNHPHIVAVHEVGRTGDGPFIAMDYVGGGSLALRTGGVPQSPRRAAEWIAAAASAVQAAHRAGIVHRDLKPSNLLLTEDGRLMVTDFGLAKRLGEAGPTRTQQVMGTPGYMAPEQAAGNTRDAGPAADVYALGAVLYELLTGRPPHRGGRSVGDPRRDPPQRPGPAPAAARLGPRGVGGGVPEVSAAGTGRAIPRRRRAADRPGTLAGRQAGLGPRAVDAPGGAAVDGGELRGDRGAGGRGAAVRRLSVRRRLAGRP